MLIKAIIMGLIWLGDKLTWFLPDHVAWFASGEKIDFFGSWQSIMTFYIGLGSWIDLPTLFYTTAILMLVESILAAWTVYRILVKFIPLP